MSDAILAQGTTIAIGDGASPEVFTTIDEVRSIGGPGASAGEIDVTHLTSTAKEFRKSLEDWGEVSLEMNYLPGNTSQESLRSEFEGTDVTNYKMTFADNSTLIFAALCLGWELSGIEVEGVPMVSVTLRLTGAPTFS